MLEVVINTVCQRFSMTKPSSLNSAMVAFSVALLFNANYL